MESWRNLRTLCIVINAVGLEEIMMIGYMFSELVLAESTI